MKKLILSVVCVLVASQAFAAGMDCANVTINQVIVNRSGSIMLQVSSGTCSVPDSGHVCLDNDPAKAMTTNLMYAQALSHYMKGQTLSRLSIDTADRPAGCGFSVVTEIR